MHYTIHLVILSMAIVITNSITPIITSHQEWFIYSPLEKTNPHKSITHNHYNFKSLQYLGQQAHQLWGEIQNRSDLTIQLQNLFTNITKDSLSTIIDEILNNDELLDQVTKASYRNVTGFLKIVLAQDDVNSWKIRLHVWQEKEKKEFPHNHKWDFFSKIISGYLLQEIYEESQDQNDYPSITYNIFEPVSLMPILPTGEAPCPCRDDYILSNVSIKPKTRSLSITSKNIIAAGESYFMPYHLIHSITPGRNAISLIFTSDKVRDNSEVFVPNFIDSNNLKYHAPSITKEELTAELLSIKNILHQLHIHQRYLPEVIHQDHYYYRTNNPENSQDSTWPRSVTYDHYTRVIQLKDSLSDFMVSANDHGNALINNKPIEHANEYLFVLFGNNMYAAPKIFHPQELDSAIFHSSFTDYGPVSSAGVLHLDDDGKLLAIEAFSGHYEPSVKNMEIAKKYLETIGINTIDTVIMPYYDRL
jgi:hypothetical protein